MNTCPRQNTGSVLLDIYGHTQRITRIFYWSTASILVSQIAGILIVLSAGDTRHATIIAISMPPVLAAFVLIQRKKFEWAAVFLATLLLSLVTILATTGLGIHHISNLAYPAILIVASLVTKQRTMVFLTLFTIGCVAWLVFGELFGAFTPIVLERSVPGDFFSTVLIIVVTAFFVRLLSDTLLRNNLRLQQELVERKLVEERLEQDIALRLQAQVALRQSEQRFRAIFKNSGVGLVLADPQGRFIETNRAFQEMLGYTEQELRDTRFSNITHPDEVEAESQLVQDKIAAGDQALQIEKRYLRKNGEVIWTRMTVSFIYDEATHLQYVVSIMEDVTERKRAENEVHQLNQKLAQRVHEREELIRELEAKNAELERFTYTVSHDLKSPLITIRGFMGFVEKDARSGNLERLQADIARIVGATDKMQRLLSELLELSRIGRMMNPPEAVPFEAIVREALALVGGQIEARGVQVVVAPDLPTVQGDRARLVEVVQNLIDNAAKFMGDQPAPRIEIGTSGFDADGKPILFVRDNGIGIEPQYHDRVFGLFNKLDAQSEGTGVGLALVKRIVEVHGGKIWVESEGMGRGATFVFTLGTGG